VYGELKGASVRKSHLMPTTNRNACRLVSMGTTEGSRGWSHLPVDITRL
jgi:hypothetical protein